MFGQINYLFSIKFFLIIDETMDNCSINALAIGFDNIFGLYYVSGYSILLLANACKAYCGYYADSSASTYIVKINFNYPCIIINLFCPIFINISASIQLTHYVALILLP